MSKKDKKEKTVYKEDDGRTLYPMLDKDGKPVSERKSDAVRLSRKEKRAMICAAYKAALPMFLCILAGFGVVFAILYLMMV